MDGNPSYFRRLTQEIGGAWNRFWFTPSDVFPLAVLRVFAGLAGLGFLASHTADLVRWFGANGLLPIQTVYRLTGAVAGGATQQQMVFRPSYFYLTDEPAMLWVLHGLGAIVLLAFTLGVKPRITSILSLGVVLSYVHRAPMVTGRLEPVLTMLLFYLCIAPGGAYLSIERWLGWGRKNLAAIGAADEGEPARSWLGTISLRLIQTHLCGFYLMIALTQLAGATWWNGSAVWWLAARTESRLIDLTPLHSATYLFNVWTHAIVLFEVLFVVLIWNRLTRPLLLAAAVVMWLSLAALTGMVGFCAVMLVANLAFVPAETLRKAFAGGRRSEGGAAVERQSSPPEKKPAHV